MQAAGRERKYGSWGQVFCWGVALARVPGTSLPGGRTDARQSNELPSIWKCLDPGSAPTSGPSPFLLPCMVLRDTRGFPWEERGHHPLVREVINERNSFLGA